MDAEREVEEGGRSMSWRKMSRGNGERRGAQRKGGREREEDE